MNRRMLAAIPAVFILAGCASLADSAGGAPSSAPSSAQSGCNARSCVISAVKKTLIGTAAKDGSAITAMSCKTASIKHNAGDTWTVACITSYSDQSKWSGYATVLVSQSQVTWEATSMVSEANSGG